MSNLGKNFIVRAFEGNARFGSLSTNHGLVETPAFMPDATQASVKGLTPQEIKATGTSIFVSNTYHLYLRPGINTILAFDGIHNFMGWDGPIVTDSGGFQVYSMDSSREFDEDGVIFSSHIDGSKHRFIPEDVIKYQQVLGSDIMMVLDHCIAFGAPTEEVMQAMHRTHRWAEKSREVNIDTTQLMFGIVQGGHDLKLREQSAGFVTSLNFDGYATGGLGVGESKETLHKIGEYTAERLPWSQPRYLMGIGSPEDLIQGVFSGYDLFDCSLPTRVARTGAFYRYDGRQDITKSRFKSQEEPLDGSCDCETCCCFSAGYVHHLFKAHELLAYRLTTIHNLRFYQNLMSRIRDSIRTGKFSAFKKEFNALYSPADEDARMRQKSYQVGVKRKRRKTKLP
ncbi:tRNA guanosine(34) transglycosylase Tgt [SAR202 cluster bacterium AD-802-E10_MRT_200m]|nr:tRNA guanosine(34) transglycosylase Tgt [SAR202 cluster bacterium AD-802-E10_MRT_200m]